MKSTLFFATLLASASASPRHQRRAAQDASVPATAPPDCQAICNPVCILSLSGGCLCQANAAAACHQRCGGPAPRFTAESCPGQRPQQGLPPGFGIDPVVVSGEALGPKTNPGTAQPRQEPSSAGKVAVEALRQRGWTSSDGSCSCADPQCAGRFGSPSYCRCKNEFQLSCSKKCPGFIARTELCGDGVMQPRRRQVTPATPKGVVPTPPPANATNAQGQPPAKVACTTDSACPSGQLCSSQTLTGASQTPGECVGAPCQLNSPLPLLCPGDQNCVQAPRRDGKTVFDLPGFCAARTMQCKANSDCPGAEWVCQFRPNGGGPLCAGIESDQCGLCAHFRGVATATTGGATAGGPAAAGSM